MISFRSSFVSLVPLFVLLLGGSISNDADAANATNSTTALSPGTCRVMAFFPTEIDGTASSSSILPYERWTLEETKRLSRSMLASAWLALEHMQTRDPAVVPELQGWPEQCSSLLDLSVVQEAMDPKRGAQIMIENATQLCAFLGTYDPNVARAMEPTATALDLPQVIFYTLDQFLTSSQRSAAIGLPNTVLPYARGLAEYLNTGQVIPHRRYVQMIYEEAYTSSYYAQCFQEDSADKYGLQSQKYQDDHLGIFPTMTPEEFQRKVLKEVKESGVKTIFFNKIDSKSINLTAHILHDLDMLSSEYLYILRPEAVPPDAVGTIFGPQTIDSPLDLLLRGGLVHDFIDPFVVTLEEDPFLKVWKKQDATTVQRIREAFPGFSNEFTDDYFQTNMPADKSSFLYDALVSIGMGACYAATEKVEIANATTTFREDIRAYNFTGASGFVDWHNCRYKSNRCNEPITYGMYNIRPVPVQVNGKNMHTYRAVLTAKHDDIHRWQKVDDNIYRDGTTNHPTKLRQEWEGNYLSSGVRAFGLFLFATAFLSSTLCLLGVIGLHEVSTIVRGQPMFLSLLCIGSMMSSCAIFTLGLDEQSLDGEISSEGLDIACMTTLWLFFGGQILSFSALYCKLRRLDMVLTFRRGVKVTAWKASLPLIALLLLTFSVLVVWTVVDPWQWEREIILMNPFETYGSCACQNFWAYFGTLMALLIVSEGLALFSVYKTADTDEIYSNTSAVVLSLLIQLQAWLIGVPILAVLGDGDSADAVFLGRALLIFVFSLSALLEVACKIYQAMYSRPQDSTDSGRIRVSGVQLPRSQMQVGSSSNLTHRKNSQSNLAHSSTHHSSTDPIPEEQGGTPPTNNDDSNTDETDPGKILTCPQEKEARSCVCSFND